MVSFPGDPVKSSPLLSVVMSVYNGALDVSRSVGSLLDQKGVDLECIIVDDGSLDDTLPLLQDYASSDPRVHVIHQENRGLTSALARGCGSARGPYIARQDCGDISLPGRLAAQLQVLVSRPEVALVSCGTRYVGPEGEFLYESVANAEDATSGLLTLELDELRGPSHHGSVMFRRDFYERVGGYREQFYFAQDIDLWTRFAELGKHIALPEILYQASFALDSLSSRHRDSQIEAARAILDCARCRRAGSSEAPALTAASRIRPARDARPASDLAASLYFVGVCLERQRSPQARSYFLKALRADPLSLKAAIRLLWSWAR